MREAATYLVDTSIWVPYLRSRRWASSLDPLVAAGRVWVHGVVLLELYAGTHDLADKRAIDAIRSAARSLGRLHHPGEDDLCLAGQILSWHAARSGAVRPRDHSHDLLVAIGAARTRSVLWSANLSDMVRWSTALRRRAGLQVRVERPPLDS